MLGWEPWFLPLLLELMTRTTKDVEQLGLVLLFPARLKSS